MPEPGESVYDLGATPPARSFILEHASYQMVATIALARHPTFALRHPLEESLNDWQSLRCALESGVQELHG